MLKSLKPLREYNEANLKLVENKTQGVLATVTGTFFVVDTPSRNNRIYPVKAWENALANSDTKRILENGLMFGSVGHKDMSFDDLIAEGKVSHVTRSLLLPSDGKHGFGEADILNTPLGRILHTCIQAGAKFSVSSKAMGEYKGKSSDGFDEVDPDRFVLERFDFVVDPGFLEAQPKLKEQFDEALNKSSDGLLYNLKDNSLKNNEEDKMSAELLSQLMKDKISVENQLKEALDSNIKLKSEIAFLSNKHKEETDNLNRLNQEEKTKLLTEIASYKTFGSSEEVKNVFEWHNKFIDKYVSLDYLDAFVKRVDILMNELARFGSIHKLKEFMTKVNVLITEVSELGTLSSIKKALAKAIELKASENSKNIKKDAEELSAKYGVPVRHVSEMLKTMGVNSVDNLLSETVESVKIKNRYAVNKVNEDKDKNKSSSILEKSRVHRLFATVSK